MPIEIGIPEHLHSDWTLHLSKSMIAYSRLALGTPQTRQSPTVRRPARVCLLRSASSLHHYFTDRSCDQQNAREQEQENGHHHNPGVEKRWQYHRKDFEFIPRQRQALFRSEATCSMASARRAGRANGTHARPGRRRGRARVHPGFLLAQNADDPPLGEPASLHPSASPRGADSTSAWRSLRGSTQNGSQPASTAPSARRPALVIPSRRSACWYCRRLASVISSRLHSATVTRAWSSEGHLPPNARHNLRCGTIS